MASRKDDSGIIDLEKLEILNLESNNFIGFFPKKWCSSKVHSIRLINNPLLCPLEISDKTKVEANCSYWKINEAKPSIGSISGGNIVILHGEGFQNNLDINGINEVCLFGDYESPGYVVSSNIIRCVTPKVQNPGIQNVTIQYQNKNIAKSKAVFLFVSQTNKINHLEFKPQLDFKEVTKNMIKLTENKKEKKNASPIQVVLLGMSKCPDWFDLQKIYKEIV